MKRLFAAVSILLFIAMISQSCNNNAAEKKADKMAGVYKMESQQIKGDGVDTTYLHGEQLKIFTGDYLMYTRYNPDDSASSFGIGTYKWDKADTVTENIIFTASDSTMNNTPGTYSLIIKKTDDGYTQVIPKIDIGQGRLAELTEIYKSETPGDKSELDGTWHLTDRYMIKGTDTTHSPAWNQYKIYHNGYFMWGMSAEDSAGRRQAIIGFGKFMPEGTGKIKESGTSSTLKDVRGHDFDISYTMNGKDQFTQHINNADGTISVEVYQRMKKPV